MSVQCKSCDNGCIDLNDPKATLCYAEEKPKRVNPKRQRICRNYRRK